MTDTDNRLNREKDLRKDNVETEEKKLARQGKGLIRLSMLLIALAAVMLLVLFDLSFVPSGAEWEEIKLEYADEYEEKSDKEMWLELRDTGRESNILKTPSNILNWIALKSMWSKEKQAYKDHEDALRFADERAAEIHKYISEAVSGYDLSEKIKFNIFLSESGNARVIPDCFNYEEDIIEKCDPAALRIEEALTGKYADETASIVALIDGESCKSVVYAPGIKEFLKEGLDYPYFNDEGQFDYSRDRIVDIMNISKNGFIVGLSSQNEGSD